MGPVRVSASAPWHGAHLSNPGPGTTQAKLLQDTLQTLQDVTAQMSSLHARGSAAVVVSAVALIGCIAAWVIR